MIEPILIQAFFDTNRTVSRRIPSSSSKFSVPVPDRGSEGRSPFTYGPVRKHSSDLHRSRSRYASTSKNTSRRNLRPRFTPEASLPIFTPSHVYTTATHVVTNFPMVHHATPCHTADQLMNRQRGLTHVIIHFTWQSRVYKCPMMERW